MGSGQTECAWCWGKGQGMYILETEHWHGPLCCECLTSYCQWGHPPGRPNRRWTTTPAGPARTRALGHGGWAACDWCWRWRRSMHVIEVEGWAGYLCRQCLALAEKGGTAALVAQRAAKMGEIPRKNLPAVEPAPPRATPGSVRSDCHVPGAPMGTLTYPVVCRCMRQGWELFRPPPAG